MTLTMPAAVARSETIGLSCAIPLEFEFDEKGIA
ncbi:UNVERIFIED_ORG: hypothetical protein ABIC48_000067 [Burkholderia territorii]